MLKKVTQKVKQMTKGDNEEGKHSNNYHIENKLDEENKTIKEVNSIEEIIYPSSDSTKLNPHKNMTINCETFFITREYIKNSFDLIKAENLIDYEEAYYKIEDMNLIGIVVLTDYRLLFKFKDEDLQKKMNLHEDYFKIPLFQITKIEKSSEKKNITRYSLEIMLKDTRLIKFIINNEQLKFFANMNNFVFPRDYNFYYAFSFRYKEATYNFIRGDSTYVDGWTIYDPKQEYLRQGMMFNDENFPLKFSDLNKNFSLCSTYPEFLILPKALTDDEIRDASYFRTKNRLPALSYLYLKNKKELSTSISTILKNSHPKTMYYPGIWRSSQTKSGITGQNRSSADEKLLKSIGQLGEKLVIYDARPYINALANRVIF